MPEAVPIITAQDSVPSERENEMARVEVMPELKKETARIPLMPEPPSKPLPTVQMKKTQPLIAMPQAAPQSTLIALAPAERSTMLDAIQMPICWGLLGISAIILIIQIWTYLS